MRGVFRPEPKFLAKITSSNARRFSASAEIPGGNYPFAREVFVGQNRSSWRYLPIWARGVCRLEPKFLAVFSSLFARCLSARTKFPGSIYQFKCEVLLGQNQNSWRYLPIWARGVPRSESKFLAVFPSSNARCYSVRTRIPGSISQFQCEVFVGQGRNSWRCFQLEREVCVSQNQKSWRFLPV